MTKACGIENYEEWLLQQSTCSACRFFRKSDSWTQHEPVGECRAKSPDRRGWPIVDGHDYCGEFRWDFKEYDRLHVERTAQTQTPATPDGR